MGRPAKYNETMLIERLDEYFVHVGGNVNVLTFKAVSDYAKEQGYDVPEHVFRRYGNVLAHFQDLKNWTRPEGEGADAFVTPDFSPTLRGCSKDCPNLCKVTSRLTEVGMLYGEYYRKAVNRKTELLKCRALCNDLEQENARLGRTIKEKDDDIRRLKDFIEKYITGEVGRHLVEEQIPGLTPELAPYLDEKEVEKLTSPLAPASSVKPKSANEELLESLGQEEEAKQDKADAK